MVMIFIIAVVGYRYLGDETHSYSWLDSIFMVVITIATVGFGEDSSLSPQLKILTIFVIVFGISTSVYVVGGFIQLMTEGELQRILGTRRMTKGIERLDQHVVLCGFGRIGQLLASDLTKQSQPLVVVERDDARYDEAAALGYLVVKGDASEEEILLAAGIAKAKSLVSALPGDAENVFITLTSRNLNPKLLIISRAEHPSTEKKLIQAGANHVVMPAHIGAQRMSRLVTRPITAEVIDLVSDNQIRDVEMGEIHLRTGNGLIGKTVAEAEAHRKHGLLVVALKQSDGEMMFNPGGDHLFEEGEAVIVMGHLEEIEKFSKSFHN